MWAEVATSHDPNKWISCPMYLYWEPGFSEDFVSLLFDSIWRTAGIYNASIPVIVKPLTNHFAADMSKPRRWVIVHAATTPEIKYNGTWVTDHGSFDSVGTNGPPYMSTMRGTSTNASFTFNFAGPAFSVMGSNIAQNGTNAKWSCSVDGTSITTEPVSTADENNRYLCSKYAMDDGPHSVTVKAIVDANQTFWFDRIQYLPTPGLPVSNVTTAVWSSDSEPKYDSSWSYKENTCRMTTQYGSMVTFDFYGMALSWYGVVLPGYTGNSTTGTWSIDDNPGQSFTINGYTVNEAGVFNQKLFDTSVYPVGTHRLKVTYNGNSTTTPLAMGYLLVQNSTIDGSTSSSTSLTSSATTTHLPSSDSEDIGAPIGGALGGVAVLIIAVVVFIFYRRRRRRKSESERNGFDACPVPTIAPELLTPFLLSSQTETTHSDTDGRATPQYGTVPHSKAQEGGVALAGVAFGQNAGSIHRDPRNSLTASGSQSSRAVVHPDSGIPSSESQVVASALDSPPEYTLN